MLAEIAQRVESLHWQQHADSLNEKGYAVLPQILSVEECKQLIESYDDITLYRSIINMKRYQFGSGEYKYFKYPLPDVITQLRQSVYPHLAKVANDWMFKLGINKDFPEALKGLLEQCHEAGQTRPTPLILKYQAGDWNALHQDLYGEVYFPFQMVVFLTQAGLDYEGGEFVMVENRPRMQSKPIVLQPRRGDAVIFTTNYRSVLGTKGYYRATVRHGVSELRKGQRFNLGVIFHDAP
ncbi:2OG-Fe(II) oxygenase [Emticicia sp. TH156]|uniref:2OG-Fe(II) oxygenase n=1 Tax=Emticicia sp. TH156 TaxID=2067454 RepID=UPI000C78C89B|nr:2OG-Fe(II) oxygenase [Emticicia sp. TH156]PLK46479.1 prolyl 4-hydroxylase subunit alpha [Emticicia sp. TH156]